MARKRTVEESLALKLREPRSVFLLGGGASFCAGLPGIDGLTDVVRSSLAGVAAATFEDIVESLLEYGLENPTIEDILSELYHRLASLSGTASDRERLEVTYGDVTRCIQDALRVEGPTEYHKQLVMRLVGRRRAEPAAGAPPVQIFTTNYDLLIELACEESRTVVINGFEGVFRRRWNPSSFDYAIGRATTHAQARRFEPSARHARIYKLHGSLSWYEEDGQFMEHSQAADVGKTPLIIYPSRLKYAESIRPPFDWLFRRFGAVLGETRLLVCIGYRFADEHLNECIFSALGNGLSLLVLSKEPIDALAQSSSHPGVSLLDEQNTILDGRQQEQPTDLWAFERFSEWLPALRGT